MRRGRGLPFEVWTAASTSSHLWTGLPATGALVALALGSLGMTGCSRFLSRAPVVGPLVSPMVAEWIPTPVVDLLFSEPFDQLDPTRWKEIEVKGRTTYTIEDLDGGRSVKAHSRAAASILLCPFRFNPDTYEWISWRWRVDRLLEQEALDRKEGSDAVARLYVYFDTGGLPWQKRNLDYVWSAHLPVETILTSAYSKTSKIIVAESGAEHLGTWRWIKRNIEEDYRRCFGDDPPRVVAIGLMTDTDNTQTEAIAYVDDLMVSHREPLAPGVSQEP